MRFAGRALAAATGVALYALVVGVLPADAHAGLEATSPSASAVLEEPPSEIVLDFDEPVERDLAIVELLFEDGSRVALDRPVSGGDATQVIAPVTAPEDMAQGVYVVRFRVTSADSHTVSGSFSFQLGTASTDQANVLARLGARDGGAGAGGVSWALWAARLAAFAGVCALLGGWMLVTLAAGTGAPGVRTRTMVWSGLAVCAVGTAATFALQGPNVLGTGFSGLLDNWSDVASTRYGKALLARLVLLALAVFPCAALTLTRTRQWRLAAATVTACLMVTFGVGAHPGSGRRPGLGVVLDTSHLGAAALWLGGLFVMAVAAREWLEGEPLGTPALRVVGRFSRVATICVPVVVVTGVLQSWRLVETFDAVRSTTFGRTLVVKIVVALLLVVLGAMARYTLLRDGVASLRATVIAEALVGLAVLGLTAGLVSVSPNVGRPIAPSTVTMTQGSISAELTLTPAVVGANEVHLVVTQPPDATEPSTSATLRMSLPDEGIENLSIALAPDGPDHYSAYGVRLPFAGQWSLQVVVGTTTTAGQESVLLTGTVRVSGR